MSAREALDDAQRIVQEWPREHAARYIDAYRAELLAGVAVTVRAAAPKRLDNDVDLHVFQVLNDLAAKIARGDLT